MCDTQHFEAKGKLRETILAMLDKRSKGLAALEAWCKKHGGMLGKKDSGWGFACCLVTKMEPDGSYPGSKTAKQPKNPENWKQHKRWPDNWFPRLSTVEGKQLDKELKELIKAVPSGREFAELVKFNVLSEFPTVQCPGVTHTRTEPSRVFISIPTMKYKPPKGIELKRISDVAYEKATKAKK